MKICIVSIMFKRGQSYVSLQTGKMLEQNGNEIHYLARQGSINSSKQTEKSNEFGLKNVTYLDEYMIDKTYFTNYLKTHNFDCVIFFEEQFQKGLGTVCKELNTPSINVIVWEAFNPYEKEHYQSFDCLMFQTECGSKKAKEFGYENVTNVGWGIDLKEWNTKKIDREDDSIRFIHVSGWGGVFDRKQTEFVIETFKKITSTKAKLIVLRQTTSDYLVDGKAEVQKFDNYRIVTGNMGRDYIKNAYAYSDVALAPSKFEGLGLSILEPLATGIPVITLDASPMNEHVTHNVNGLLCKVSGTETYEEIYVKGALTRSEDFLEMINSIADNPSKLEYLVNNCRDRVEGEDAWGKCSLRILEEIEKVVSRVTDEMVVETVA